VEIKQASNIAGTGEDKGDCHSVCHFDLPACPVGRFGILPSRTQAGSLWRKRGMVDSTMTKKEGFPLEPALEFHNRGRK